MATVPPEIWVRRLITNNPVYVSYSTQVSTKECCEDLSSTEPASHLTENSAPLRQSLLLTELSSQNGYVQNAEETPIYVSIRTNQISYKKPANVIEKLEILGVECTENDIDYLLNHDRMSLSILLSDYVTKGMAQAIITSTRKIIRSVTRRAIFEEHSYCLFGPLQVGQGQLKSSFYGVLSVSGRIIVAKLYNKHFKEFNHELTINAQLNHKNIVKFIDSFSIQNNTRHIIIMPLFSYSLLDLLLQKFQFPAEALKCLARNVFDALGYLHSKGYCFGDVKPSNIMLTNGVDGNAVLVDFGSTVRLHEQLEEYSEQYCLGIDFTYGCGEMDWICLGTTLAQLSGFDIMTLDSVNSLTLMVTNSNLDNQLKDIILSCVTSRTLYKIESAFN